MNPNSSFHEAVLTIYPDRRCTFFLPFDIINRLFFDKYTNVAYFLAPLLYIQRYKEKGMSHIGKRGGGSICHNDKKERLLNQNTQIVVYV